MYGTVFKIKRVYLGEDVRARPAAQT